MKKDLYIALAVTAVLLLSIAKIISGNWQKWFDHQSQQGNSFPTVSILPTTPPKASVPTGLQTYKNDQYGFEFQYPSTWSVGATSPDAFFDLTSQKDCLYFNVYHYISEKTLSDFLKSKYDTNKLGDLGLINNYPQINNKETIAIGPNGVGEEKTVFIKNGSAIFEISVNLDLSNPNDPTDTGQCTTPDTSHYDQILSTFKFTDPKTALGTASWKTYQNKQEGYEYQYASDWVLKDSKISTPEPECISLVVKVSPNISTKLEDFISKDFPMFNAVYLSHDNTVGKYQTLTVPPQDMCGPETVYAKNSNSILKIEVQRLCDEGGGNVHATACATNKTRFNNDYLHLLSTFKFTL